MREGIWPQSFANQVWHLFWSTLPLQHPSTACCVYMRSTMLHNDPAFAVALLKGPAASCCLGKQLKSGFLGSKNGRADSSNKMQKNQLAGSIESESPGQHTATNVSYRRTFLRWNPVGISISGDICRLLSHCISTLTRKMLDILSRFSKSKSLVEAATVRICKVGYF